MTSFILDNFGFKATKEQEKAVVMMSQFIFQHDADSLFVLKGFAGTGKTSLVGALVRSMDALKQRTVLMAPTGRAAKVFALHASHPAFTIHKRIYRQKSFTGSMTDFLQNVNLMKHTLFIVDEASMISNESRGGSAFGTGRLLDDLIQFVYSGEGCRLMLVGDTAQLPPVGEALSPALDAAALGGYGLHVEEVTLTEVVRQLSYSGILWNATMLRRMMAADDMGALPRLRFQGFADVVYMPGNELIEALEQAYWQVGQDQTIVVTRSNVRANAYNQGIRGRILGLEEELTSGDQLMVVKNNYHWIKGEKGEDGKTARDGAYTGSGEEGSGTPAGGREEAPVIPAMDFIANGDVAVVRRLRNERRVHGFRFADVSLRFPDYDDVEADATIVLDTLASEAPTLTHEQQEALFQRVWDDYPELTTKRERMAAVKADPFFNALQVKYAYAITCHKAQGGQWQRVFIDQGYVTQEMLTPEYFRWLYTALTRATEKVYLVNWPTEGLEN